ncbi:putative MFS family arabinose efflux permease [Herbihabitans rhizosphaerae]|uniref:Putative MFS family arabinose efflux permease n=1 Tax=Herbihabitans rhizosphaerae TaxID=1872711 RepID=A0A4Q7KXK9_9PSEU|nr:MFS transporter [Herbihabitans rhizosphaerae]RZS41060.1 putative MFS family arabinose efflux permease [Herbihabitans rhizosphaerae]
MTHPLRDRQFRRVFLGRSLSTFSDAIVPAALTLAVVQATGSAGALATVLLCALLPRLVLLPIGGVIADRFDARKIALTTDLVRAAAQLVVGVELIGGDPQLTHIAIAEAVGGAASGCALPTLSPLVIGTVTAEQRQRANSMTGASASLARLCGPGIAGLLIFTVGAGWVFVLTAVAFLVSASLLGSITVRRVEVPRASLRADLVAGWTEVRTRGWLWSSLVAHAVWNLAAGVLLTLGPLIAVRQLGGEGVWVAALQAGGIGLLIGSLAAGRARVSRPVLIANIALAGYAVPLLLFALAVPAVWTIGAYGLALAGLGFLNPTWSTVLQAEVPEHLLARVTAWDWLFSLGAQPLGYALAPLAAAHWGDGTPLIIASVLVAVSCLGTAAVPAVRELRARPAVAVAQPAR